MIYGVDLPSGSSKDKLWNACSEFVGTIFYDIFKKMYHSIPKSNLLPESSGERWFKEMLFYEYSKVVARENLKPLVNMIYQNLAKKGYGS
ncbi:rod-binding protein [Pseudothermotoga thermarum]|uniref:Flagellar protein FlgJ n=1 Tax=Pseudothermotoga thermarum DSM 5069 TaxID=688269 RepID=F7YVQ4_9THEM|nr:rod-binding protein [Pseudothermotoga thermarum]AEH51719.1 hypothetical protein Theth_1672 [Pseudothermotoga thermarum DSM 5069]